jgi:RNA polymerase sigma factor for flagellar operon FliA
LALSVPERDALLQKHLGFVQRLARALARDLPSSVTIEDLVSAGNVGLLAAAERFDPTRGASFTTFAYYRVRGSMYDAVRQSAGQDPRYRARVAAQAAVDDLVEATLGTRPHTQADPQAEAALALAGALEEMATVFTMAEYAEALAPEPLSEDPETVAAAREGLAQARAAMGRMPSREREMLEGVYFQHLTIEEAGQRLGLTKGWASRLHARALKLLGRAVNS